MTFSDFLICFEGKDVKVSLAPVGNLKIKPGPFLLVVLLCRFRAVPQFSGTRRTSASVLPTGQPGQQQRSGHQLPGLSERHICGGQNAPACGEVQHLQ